MMGAAALSGTAHGQSDGWVTLLDQHKMGDWDEVGKANWAIRTERSLSTSSTARTCLISSTKRPTRIPDQGEFWADAMYNSGIFSLPDPRR